MESQSTPLDPCQALLEAARAGEDLAQRAKAPIWYHPLLGLLMGGLVAVQATPVQFQIAYFVVFCIGLILLIRTYRSRTGMWISGYRAGRTRIVAFATAALVAAIMLASVFLQREGGLWWAPLAAAPLVAALATAAGFVWEAAFRADLKSDLSAGDQP